DAIDAVVLSGGSVYGLEAASAVTTWLGARGRGFQVPSSPLAAPIVPAAILFDLANGGGKDWGETPPYGALGRTACEAAGEDFALGSHGAGMGAIAGPLKGGLGSASIVSDAGLAVGALVAVNAIGSPVVPGSAAFWAAPFEIDGEFGAVPMGSPAGIAARAPFEETKLARTGTDQPANTTIAVIATNAALTPVEAKRLAIMAHDGLARALRPAHTPFDGDTVFALATGVVDLPEPRPRAVAALGALGADTLARAIARGVYEAEGIAKIVSYRDRYG
ncbi:MAG: P1 family peptidase, partial [Rhizobiales bacterium]|nr:P1 family peptidase [Hyphomicrobiales bacterium]